MEYFHNDLRQFTFSLRCLSPEHKPLISQNLIIRKSTSYPKKIAHIHDFPQFFYCLEDNFLIETEDFLFKLRQGDLLIVPIGCYHIVHSSDRITPLHYCANIKYNIWNDTEDELFLNSKHHLFTSFFNKDGNLIPHLFSLSPDSQKKAEEYLSSIYLASSYAPMYNPEDIFNNFESLFSLPELDISKKVKKHTLTIWQNKLLPILKIMAYINENYPQKILIDDMLRFSALGHTVFFSSFKKVTGMTFTTYLQLVRLLNLDNLMTNTNFSLAHISLLCGFSNQSHMEIAYKKYSNALPKLARKHAKAWWKEYTEVRSKTNKSN